MKKLSPPDSRPNHKPQSAFGSAVLINSNKTSAAGPGESPDRRLTQVSIGASGAVFRKMESNA
jgi:hypothetical protein